VLLRETFTVGLDDGVVSMGIHVIPWKRVVYQLANSLTGHWAMREQDEPSRDVAEARSEVMRCIVSVCTAEALLNTPHTYHAAHLPVMAALVELLAPSQCSDVANRTLSPLALSVFHSLLNTLLSYQVRSVRVSGEAEAWVGHPLRLCGTSQANGWWEGTTKDVFSHNLEHCLHLLLVLLDFPTPTSSSPQPPLRGLLLGSIDAAEQFQPILQAVVRWGRSELSVVWESSPGAASAHCGL
jgi:hypothetical protein